MLKRVQRCVTAPPGGAVTNLAGFVEELSDNVGADAPRLQRRLVVRSRVARGLAAETPQLDHTRMHTHYNTYIHNLHKQTGQTY